MSHLHAFRIAAAAMACSALLAPAWATTPASGQIDDTNKSVSFTGGPYPVANSSGLLDDYVCDATNPCDNFALTVAVSAGYIAAHPDDKLKFSLSPDTAADDVELQVRDADGNLLDSSRNGPGTPEEIVLPLVSGTYTVETMAGTPASGAHASVEIFTDAPPVTLPPTGLAPRFQVHPAQTGLADDAGEPSLGHNKNSGHTMFISYTTAYRQTYVELDPAIVDIAGNPLPQACDAVWEPKPGTLTTLNSLDPILFTDEPTGRTFNSQLSGDNSLMEFTDDDGENWTPAQAGPPNGGADHQTVATGIYPASIPSPNLTWPETGPKRAVYYCSQSVATAFCSRSDDGGLTFGPGLTFKNPDCAAGALHGHVKVAPDGTVYVPDSSQCVLALGGTASNVLAFRSDDAGATWSVKNVPSSVGGAGSDPSIGIATDGTLYMCYENGDSRVHMAVSHDKGDTWINDQDIGAALGIAQTRFPQAIAGDGDENGPDTGRAACAFLGTTGARPESPTNDGNSLDFEGVWYGYVATTYDGGKTYHLANVTPNDPVQGWGGICGSGTCRNLLDFNDLQIDDQGRLLFGFADGCTRGCVQDPSANSFASKGTIVRQTGGRTLFAAFDDQPATPRFNETDPLPPLAACASETKSVRTIAGSRVAWNEPDTGGSPITNYKVYRSLDKNGPFTFLGDAGTKNAYTDTTAKPSVANYYYQVEAYNALGVAPKSNVIELAVTVGEVDTCTVPGEVIELDPEGDGVAPDTDIIFLGVAEPKELADFFVLTLKLAQFTAGQPPADAFYPILFPSLGNLYLALDTTQGPAEFEYGHAEELPQGLLAFNQEGLLDDRSGFTPDGTVTLIVPRALFGDLEPGRVIAGFDARTRVGSQSATSRDTAGPSDYVVRGTAICDSTGLVVAILTADVNEGAAPLTVTYTISGAQSKGKALKSFELVFGDEAGAAPYAGTFDGAGSVQVTHTYAAGGVYRAHLKVIDEADGASTNLAEETITVGGDLVLLPDADTGNNRLGGAMPALGLALMGLLAGVGRRRRRGPRRHWRL